MYTLYIFVDSDIVPSQKAVDTYSIQSSEDSKDNLTFALYAHHANA